MNTYMNMSVDIFYFMAGLLAFFLLPGQLEKASNSFKFFWSKFILRFLRLMIPAWFVLALLIFARSMHILYDYQND